MPAPTPYADLNGLLATFVVGVQEALGANFCGAYLQGSFAVGDADRFSDVDFIVVTEAELTVQQQASLQSLHSRLYALELRWAKHLEGSYASKDVIRRIDPERRALLYLDNGASELASDNHCNTAIVRWSLREHGVALAGPEAATLIDPVSRAQLTDHVVAAMREFAAFAREPQARFAEPGEPGPGMSRWKQQYLVQWYCRALQTLEQGLVASKKEASVWALAVLDPHWSPLVRRAIDERPDPWERVHQRAESLLVAETLAFVTYAMELAGLE